MEDIEEKVTFRNSLFALSLSYDAYTECEAAILA